MIRNTCLLVLVLISGGCNTPLQSLTPNDQTENTSGLILAPEPQYQQMSYRKTASGIFVPAILTDSDVDKILEIVRHRTKEEIVSIRRLKDGNIRVETGEYRGPLSGGGCYFDLYKTGSRWELCADGLWRSYNNENDHSNKAGEVYSLIARSSLPGRCSPIRWAERE